METSKQAPQVSFDEAILKAKVAQICNSIGYHAITQDSSNILVDTYRRLFHHLARHCKDAANNNRRVEPTLLDLVQAFNFVNISIPELQEHIKTVKLPLNVELTQDTDCKPLKGIQRNLLVDDLLEAEKNSHLEDQDDGENKTLSENGVEEDQQPSVPLLKDTYVEIANKFTDCTPVTADKKIRGGRIVLLASTKLKISTPAPQFPTVPKSTGPGELKEPTKLKDAGRKKLKTAVAPLDPLVVEPVQSVSASNNKLEKKRKKKKEAGKEKKKISPDEFPAVPKTTSPIERKEPTKPKGSGRKKLKATVAPLDPLIAEPTQSTSGLDKKPGKKRKKEVERKKGTSEQLPVAPKSISPSEPKKATKSKATGRKKPKAVITPLDPSIAEPPSFFPILGDIVDEPPVEDIHPQSTSPPVTQQKVKKKKKTNNQFAIVTETVTAVEDKEWFCPACGGPDDGDLMVQCDSCQEWYHLGCTSLSKPPEDDENWECDICAKKAKQAQTPVVEATTTKTTPPPPPPTQAQPSVSTHGTSQDDLCPECNLPDDGTLMIQCDDPFCAKWFHGKCVDLLEEPKEDESWFCKVCVDKQQSAFKRRRRPK